MPTDLIPLTVIDGEPRVDSRLIAEQLGVEHESFRKLVYQYQPDFEEFGQLRFEIGVVNGHQGGGNPQKYVLLTEDQSYLGLTYTKNTEQSRALKKRLVRSFGDHRRRLANPTSLFFPVIRQSERPRPALLSSETINVLQRLKGDLDITGIIGLPSKPGNPDPLDSRALFTAVIDDLLHWRYPYAFAYGFSITGKSYFMIRISDVLHHLSNAPHFKDFFGMMDGKASRRIEQELHWGGWVKKIKPAPVVDGVRLNYRLELAPFRHPED